MNFHNGKGLLEKYYDTEVNLMIPAVKSQLRHCCDSAVIIVLVRLIVQHICISLVI